MKKLVVKLGSSIIAPKGKLDKALISRLIEDILAAEARGYKTVIVSSGAIACGLNALGLARKPQDTHSLMAISSLGQILLMDVFNEKCKAHDRMCAQLLLTWDDFDSRKRFINIRTTIERLLAMDVIPIINENDAVSFEEIRMGDNDCISARVADVVQAQLLVIFSDVEGLLDANGQLVREVPQVDERIMSLVRESDSTHTHGGMRTKLQAARIAACAGTKTVLTLGSTENPVRRILSGEKIGTLFLASKTPTAARKRWIQYSKKIKGTVIVDAGARQALVEKGKSLLRVGIVGIEGAFKSQDAVRVIDQNARLLGYGIVNYDAQVLTEAKKRLEKEVIHRDNFVQSPGNGGSCGHEVES